MSCRQHEAVTVRPVRVAGIVTQKAVPQNVRNRRKSHRCTGVTGISLLHGIHRKRPDGVYAQLVKLGAFIGLQCLAHQLPSCSRK